MTTTSNARTVPEPARPSRRYLKATLAGGAGGLLTLVFFILEQRPELTKLLLERVVVAWGPQFVIVLLLFAFLYLLADRYVPRLITAQSETALALQNLATAVEQLLARDNAFQREQDVLLNHVARRLEALHKLVESQHRTLNGRLSRLAGKENPDGALPPPRLRRARKQPSANRKKRKSPPSSSAKPRK